MKAKACIFDFDGVIVDSEKYHHLAWQQVANEIGVDLPYDEYAPLKSAGRQVVIPYLFQKAGLNLTPQLFDYYRALRGEKITAALRQLSPSDVMPGVVNFLRTLKAHGIPCAVASSSAAATETAKRFDLYDLFDVFVDGNNGLPNKPAPDLFLHTAHLLNVQPTACVVFEDSLNGLTAAKNAGMHAVGIQTHFTTIADKVIDTFVDANLQLIEFED